ncbi:MAG: transglutaminase-like domain-containing protein [bacterium]
MLTTLVLLLVVALVAGCPGPGQPAAAGRRESAETWLLTELDGSRIGHSVTRVDRFEHGWRFEHVMELELEMLGVSQLVKARSVAVTSDKLELQSLDFRFQAQDRVMEAAAAVQENVVIIKPVGDRPRTLKLVGPVYPTEALGQLVISRGAATGTTFEVPMFDVSSMSVERASVKVEGWEPVAVLDSNFHALKVRTTTAGITVTTWLDSAGLTVREDAPPGLRSTRTTPARAVAGAGQAGSVDLLRMFRVDVDTLIPEPGAVRRARLAVTGVGPEELPGDAGMTVSGADGALIVEVVSVEPPAGRVDLPVAGQDSFLTASMTIQCDAPELVERARAALAGETDAVAAARLLTSWVFDNVEKVPTASFPTALDVLRNLRGDCNEHAVLYAGLARSAGLPCRVVVGLVYLDGSFYYHAWNDAWLGRWVPVDPTFGEFPAGALRLRLGGGELRDQSRILPLVGRIGIRVLDYDRAPGAQRRESGPKS